MAGCGTLFQVAMTTFLCAWSMRLEVQDQIAKQHISTALDFAGSFLPFVTSMMSFISMISVPIILFYEDEDILISFHTIWERWLHSSYRRLITLIGAFFYIYQLIETCDSISSTNFGLWRLFQSCLFVMLLFVKFWADKRIYNDPMRH